MSTTLVCLKTVHLQKFPICKIKITSHFEAIGRFRKSIMLKIVGIFSLVLLAVAFAAGKNEKVLSACEEDRARRLNATLTEGILHLIPTCEENGDYAALQCFTTNDYCVCYRRNGEKINTLSKDVKACGCVRQKDDAINAGVTYIPKCDKNGYFQAKQCHGEECWCVDKFGKIIPGRVDIRTCKTLPDQLHVNK